MILYKIYIEGVIKEEKGTFMYYFSGKSTLDIFLEKAMQLVFPMGTYCVCCGSCIDISRTYCICDNCMSSINWGYISVDLDKERKIMGRTTHLDSVNACMVYGLHSKRIVFDLKYNKKTFLARPISMIMADRLINDPEPGYNLSDPDIVVPVPVHKSRMKERGFNQAELISGQLIMRLENRIGRKLKHLPHALLRNRYTAAQRAIRGEERFANIEGAFEVNKKYMKDIVSKSILLVDDILTTGTTADLCAKTLKESGASRVDVICLATGNYYLKGSFRERNDESFLDEL